MLCVNAFPIGEIRNRSVRHCRRLLLALGVASVVLATGVTEARAAAVDTPPTYPMPANAPDGPPPIAALTAAGDTAPAEDQIADPITPAAVCGEWHLQHHYGDRWPTGSSWWEYSCSRVDSEFHNLCTGGGACDAYCPLCWTETETWTDYFYWDGSRPVFYGESYSDAVLFVYQEYNWPVDAPDLLANGWWDATSASWSQLAHFVLFVGSQGSLSLIHI